MSKLKSEFNGAKTQRHKTALAQIVGGQLLMSMAKTVGCSRRLLNSKYWGVERVQSVTN